MLVDLFIGFQPVRKSGVWMLYLGSQTFSCAEDLSLTQAQPKCIGVDSHQYIQGTS